jgi:hypothetical protein
LAISLARVNGGKIQRMNWVAQPSNMSSGQEDVEDYRPNDHRDDGSGIAGNGEHDFLSLHQYARTGNL